MVASDIRPAAAAGLGDSGPFEVLDVLAPGAIAGVIQRQSIDTIYHMAAILSASGEKKPQLAWEVNLNGTFGVLEAARENGLARVFCPSSIAVFGPETPRLNTPNDTVLKPRTMYGLTKVASELLVRLLRPALRPRRPRLPLSRDHQLRNPPRGRDDRLRRRHLFRSRQERALHCFLREETRLPMMYMPDCLKATMDLMEADFSRLRHHADFNVTAMSFSAGELAAEIRKHIPGFEVTYSPDYRQAIADSWPESIDDSAAREEWGWRPDYDLAG